MNLGTNLSQYAKNIGISSQKDLAKKVQENEKTISSYITGKSYPTYRKLIKLCNLLNCDPDTLMKNDYEYTSDEFSQQEQQILSAYQNLSSNPDKKEIVDFILGIGEHDSKSNPIETKSTIVYRFPVYEQQAAAGAGITGRDGKFTMENIFTDDIPQNAIFGVHIKGESMINTDSTLIIEDIPDNSIVLLNPKVSNSDLHKTIVVASINNEVICKYFLIEKDGVHFYSLNRKEHEGDDRFAKSPNDYRIIGQVVKIIKPNEHE